ncbi:copper homeostasis membrane protein CopD [uncultured Herbaspirillum sp.]|uniref:copper homeostasis membrane protein CopD n=1 Tax=uncultured Herbaspirillum sp. TaxID=160236 RepID=UPI002636E236|nr:copper homeostasis membrane protein CopD [uncultured Herbaspirillum sp.]
MISSTLLLGLCRLSVDGAALFLWGASLTLLVLVAEPLRSHLWQRLAGWRRFLYGLLFIAVLSSLPLQASILGDGWADAWRFDMLAAVANGTSIGTAWWFQLVAVSLLLLSVTQSDRMRLLACLGGSGIVLASLALTGHAVMNEGGEGLLHQANDLLHVWSVGAWMGALPIVLLILSGQYRCAYPELVSVILRRFSNVGHAVVALVLLTGLVNTILILGRLPLDFHFRYQALLTIKIMVAGFMVAIAVFNRYVLVPTMRQQRNALHRIRLLTMAEILLSCFALVLLAWLGMLQPN